MARAISRRARASARGRNALAGAAGGLDARRAFAHGRAKQQEGGQAMIGLLLIAAAGIGYWAWKTRDGQALRVGDVAAVVAALIGLRFMSRGSELLGLIALGGAGWWLWFRRRDAGTATAMSPAEARRLLDVPADATTEEIRAAHRRLVARVHPDVGGSADLTRQVNAARDALLAGRRVNP
jgi:hypothetical protein